jgi:hypothetical protein
MTLPTITAPSGTPVFLAEGHGIEEDSVFAQVKFATGHSRARRVWTVTERVVSVQWFLEADEMLAVDDWYENVLLAGAREFSAYVRNQGDGMLWWRARWVEYRTEMLHKGRGRVTGSLLLTGEGSVTGPDTGALEMEIAVALLDTRSTVSVPSGLAMEISIALLQPQLLAAEITVALLSVDTTVGPSSGDIGRLWAGMAITPGRSDDIDITDQTLIQRAWMEIANGIH